MTYHDDPNLNRPRVVHRDVSYTGWIIGAVAILAVFGVLFYTFSDNTGTQVATEIDRPAITAPANTGSAPPTTSGSGTTAPAPSTPSPANR